MLAPAKIVERAGRSALAPPEKLSPSQWAEKKLDLSERVTQYPGRFSYDRSPYLREIIDQIANPFVELVTFAKAAQVGGTQGILAVGIGYAIDQDPGPAMIVFPSSQGAKEYSEERLQPLIDDCSTLRRHKLDARDKYRKQTMMFDRMNLALVGAGSPANLASRPIRYLFCDEIDKWKLNTKIEGNPLDLADKRTRTFWNRKRFRISTPTVPTGPIWQSYLEGDQRQYWVPCPHCDGWQVLKFDHLTWDQDARNERGWDLGKVRESTYYRCDHCDGKILDKHKRTMLLRGEWRAQIKGTTRHASYHLSALYPLWVPFGDVSTAFLQSKPYPDKLRDFINSTLGEPWEERGDTATEDDILKHRSDYPEGECPGVPLECYITADVQQDSLYYVIRAWGEYETSWLIRYGQVLDFESLQEVASMTYRCKDGKQLRVTHGFIDSGFRTDEVYRFCEKYGWAPCKGIDSSIQTSPYRWANVSTAALSAIQIKTDYFKDFLQLKLKISQDDPGAWLLHRETEYAYGRHLAAEAAVEQKDKFGRIKRVYKRYDRENHWLDCEVYQLAAAASRGIRHMRNEPETAPSKSKSKSSEEQLAFSRRDGRDFWDR